MWCLLNFSIPLDQSVNKVSQWLDVFPPAFSPWLSFVGTPWQVLSFPMFELQKQVDRGCFVRSDPASFQGRYMITEIKTFYSTLEVQGIPKRCTHRMGNTQFEYDNWLASQCRCSETEEWRKEMCLANGVRKEVHPEKYRGEWEDHHLISQAYQDFFLYS